MIVALSAGRDAPTELRERLALDADATRALLSRRWPGLAEIAILSTCHRTEIYGVAAGPDAIHALAQVLPALEPADRADLRLLEGTDAIEHLFRVAAGLDSLVLGEREVLGQVRRAMRLARETGASGPVLGNVLARAVRVGRRARSETGLGRLAGSIGSLAARYLADRLGSLSRRTGVVVGAGEAAADTARALVAHGADLTVVSRTASSARRLAAAVDARAGAVPAGVEFAVVAVAGGGPVALDAPVVIDLSMPRAVEPRDGIELRRLDDLSAPEDTDLRASVTAAEVIVRAEVDELQRWMTTRASGPAIRDLRARAESIVGAEVTRALRGLELTDDEAERVAAMGMRIANKLLHGPTRALREAEEAERNRIRALFGL